MDEPLVYTQFGTLKGQLCQDIDQNIYYAFKGIPYAEPPLGKLRFKAPRPPKPWNGVLDATNDNKSCFSKHLFEKKLVGTEDCLVLSVFTKSVILNKDERNLKPVMFWIHGGGFTCGSNSTDFYGPDYLMTEDVVVVSINYRLGILGFLSLDDPILEVPGNAGLKDMVLALEWVQNNIRNFNGNPGNVTIFGESAGGMAVHLLMLSPMSKNLFHKAIAQSGTSLNPGCRGRNFVDEIRKASNKTELNDKELLEFLQDLDVEELLEIQNKIPYFLDPNTIGLYGLVIEKESESPGFMTQDHIDVILSGKAMDVPFILGYTKDEGMMVDTYRFERIINMIMDLETNIPYMMGYQLNTKETKSVAEKIRKFYFGNQKFPNDNKIFFYEMAGDVLLVHGIYCTAKKHAAKYSSPVYLYRMSIETSLKFLQDLIKDNKPSGTVHGDDLAYLFRNIFTPFPLKRGSIEEVSVRRFIKLWTNFAYYGNPTPTNDALLNNLQWEKFTKNSHNVLEVGKELEISRCFEQERMDFWNLLFSSSPKGYKYVD